jgi:hypothetical protein
MKKKDLVSLFNGLATVSGLIGVKFAYACNKNRSLIFNEVNSINQTLTPSQEFSDYENKRLELGKKYAKKDTKGEPMAEDKIINGKKENVFIFEPADRKIFDAELAILQAESKGAIDGRQKQIDEYNKLLEEDTDVQLFRIPITDVPQDITVEQLQGIYMLIQD